MKKINIGIVTFPIGKAGFVATSNLVDILSSISNETYLITGNKGFDFLKQKKNINFFGIEHKKGKNIFIRITRYIYAQLLISYKLKKIIQKADVWFFFIGGNNLLLPMITVKLFGKKAVLVLAGSSYLSFKSTNSKLSIAIKILEDFNRLLSNRIILYSPNLINEWHLERYMNKIIIADRHFLDLDLFKIKKKIEERKNIVGYIGRFSEEKGISVFIKSIPISIKKIKDIEFLIAGDGELNTEIQNFILTNNLNNKVKLNGWIPHNDVPDFLNKLKLLIIPSYTEGLPNILLEAMACGTPVLATPVGAIPDIIHDRETGFILSENNPDNIVDNIINILNNPYLDRIVTTANNFVEKKYTFSECVKNYEKVIQEVLK